MINRDFYDKLAGIVSAEAILENEPMSKHTTFRIGGAADLFVSPKVSQVADILALAKEYEVPVTVIGNGSNLLVGDKGIRGLVLSFANIGKSDDGVRHGCHFSLGSTGVYSFGDGRFYFSKPDGNKEEKTFSGDVYMHRMNKDNVRVFEIED